MNEQEAIRVLKEAKDSTQEEYDVAFDMAIKSLEMQDKLKQWIEKYKLEDGIEIFARGDLVELLEEFRLESEKPMKEITIMENISIKDSGQRTEFATGAVRDMHEGKGRMDLLPLTAIIELSKHCEEGALKYGEHNIDKGIPQHSLCDSAMRHLAKYMRGDKDENHLRASCWNLMWALEQSVNRPELNDLIWNEVQE